MSFSATHRLVSVGLTTMLVGHAETSLPVSIQLLTDKFSVLSSIQTVIVVIQLQRSVLYIQEKSPVWQVDSLFHYLLS